MSLAALRDPKIAETLAAPAASSSSVSQMLPDHEEYVRVLSPARDRSGTRITWRSLADAPLHANVQWKDLQSSLTNDLFEPQEGSIDPDTATALVELLAPRTTTPERCVFLVWEGYAGLKDVVASAPKVTVGFEQRAMHVLEGNVADAIENVDSEPFRRLPLWWLPLDHAWSVGGDLYGRSIYIGSTHATIHALRSSPELEVLPVSPNHEVGTEDL